MFRDRVVSLEQTLEGGEKHLSLLKAMIAEAIPDLEFHEYALDQEHDTFVMSYKTPEGIPRQISWSRMVLYDAERIPAVVQNTTPSLREKIVEFIRQRKAQPLIAVTFRHLEDGWADTPERKPEQKKPRSGPAQKQQRGQREKGGKVPAPPPAPAVAAGTPGKPGERPAGGRRRFRRRRRRRGGGGPAGPGPAAGTPTA